MHFFLLVHGGIGLLEHFVYVDDAVAPGQMHKAAAETLVIPWGSCLGEIILYVGDLPLGQLQGAAAQNSTELVAAHPGKDVRGTEMPLYEVGEAEQIFVALGVAIGVVDEFEVVEVTIAEDQLRSFSCLSFASFWFSRKRVSSFLHFSSSFRLFS